MATHDRLSPAPDFGKARAPLLYDELADWFPLLSPPDEYVEESIILRDAVRSAVPGASSLFELGSGAGSNAFQLKRHFACTLSDLSPRMLEVSRRINPDCEHVVGDMRTLRLGRTFDAVLVHDAVAYLTTEGDLREAIATAFVHCRPGGVALFVPDYVRESFDPATRCGGTDGDGRALRYLEWVWDPDPDDTTYVTDFIYALREGEELRTVHDRHVEGLFPRATWHALLEEAGFRLFGTQRGRIEEDIGELFVAVRPSEP